MALNRPRASWRHRAASLVCLRGETWRRRWQHSPSKTLKNSQRFPGWAEADARVSAPRLAPGVRRFSDARLSVFKLQEPQRWWKTRSDRGNYRPAKPRWFLPHLYLIFTCLLLFISECLSRLRFTSACCCLPQNLPPIWDSTHCCHYLTDIWDSHLPHIYLSFTSILSFTSKNDWHLWFHSHLAYINSYLLQFYLSFTSENNWHLWFHSQLPYIYLIFTSILHHGCHLPQRTTYICALTCIYLIFTYFLPHCCSLPHWHRWFDSQFIPYLPDI